MEGVVNTNEDSKAVQRDLGRGKTLAGNCYLGGGGDVWAGQHLGPPGEPGRGKGCPRAGVELGANAASLGVGHRSKPESRFFPSGNRRKDW